ncbi:uncharacterized protein B0H64DRAFT_437554 [Chaetomium fimeti]|uniref:Uncharacterized protein n=1 Tax=Chaetomium fimeti TaxID=1854472 RepID=A0AAE0HPQ7_9PEZI|nr:hypothetical protein B0H64DRAFT_437554 [Chaetomium fimeti]
MAPPSNPPKSQQGESPSGSGKNEASSPHDPPAPSPSSSSVNDNLAQALKDLARGEQTASTLEANLTNLEGKLDEILASFGVSEADLDALDEQEKSQSSGVKGATGGAENGGAGEDKKGGA